MLATSEEGMLWVQARLDTCVTVVDAHSLRYRMASLGRFADTFGDGLDEAQPMGPRDLAF